MAISGVQVAARPEPALRHDVRSGETFSSELERVLDAVKENPEGPQPKKFDLPGPDREGGESPDTNGDEGETDLAGGVAGVQTSTPVEYPEGGGSIDADLEALLEELGLVGSAAPAAQNSGQAGDAATTATTGAEAAAVGVDAMVDMAAETTIATTGEGAGPTGTLADGPDQTGEVAGGITASAAIEPASITGSADGGAAGSGTTAVDADAAGSDASELDLRPAAAKGAGDAAQAESAAKTGANAAVAAPAAGSQGVQSTEGAAPDAAATSLPTRFDMSKLGEGIAGRIRTGHNVKSLSLELHPAELGGVRVDVRQVDGVTHLVLTPDRQVGGQRLAAAMADLRHDLEQAGVNIGDLQLRQESAGSQQGRGDGGVDDSARRDSVRGGAGPRVEGAASVGGEAVRRGEPAAGSAQHVAIDL